MSRQIIINSTPRETRIATTEEARVLNCQVERARERGLAGSIYKGRVTRVLPGMQAAFVDIGLAKAAFLPNADFLAEGETADSGTEAEDGSAGDPVRPPIEARVREGQEVIVQIRKEPIGSKGARITSHISLPGRLLVYLPGSAHLGISRRIADEAERLRLQAAIEAVGPDGGIIVRTAGEGVDESELQSQVTVLRNLWRHVLDVAASKPAPALLHEDLDLTLRTIRDLRIADVGKVVVDHPGVHRRIRDFVDSVMPEASLRVDLYEESEPIFERYGIEAQIDKALQPHVWLRSGGYIVIDATEALTSIDVNTGRFIGKTDQRQTALKTNLEAARAIAQQLRLRDIGGVIVIDFIDLERDEDRTAVLTELRESLDEQRTRTEVHGFSELGLVEMTRHRKRENLSQRLCEPCPQCNGTGFVKATATIGYEILRALYRAARAAPAGSRIEVSLHPSPASFLGEFEPDFAPDLESELGVEIRLDTRPDLPPEDYHVAVVGGPGAAPLATPSTLAESRKCD